MKILYVAKHGSGGNDDEGAVFHALRELGHSVRPVREQDGGLYADRADDLLLFHKWYDFGAVRKSRAKVKAFWHFDLVKSDQWARKDWEDERAAWMANMIPLVDFGFCTDGDWVNTDGHHALRFLPQGADGRVVGPGKAVPKDIDILFAGSWGHGGGRASHVERLKSRYGDRLTVVGNSKKNRVYGRALADLIARSKVVVAPDSPVTDRYWSNRVYVMLGFGACLVHPYSKGLEEQYADRRDVAFYHDRDECEEVIDGLCVEDQYGMTVRREIYAERGLETTKEKHLYRHRCEELIRVVTRGA